CLQVRKEAEVEMIQPVSKSERYIMLKYHFLLLRHNENKSGIGTILSCGYTLERGRITLGLGFFSASFWSLEGL
ncbi:hypothetical protein BDZ89DRAFT_1057324, partial [Hymenopellis radicata]